MTLAQAVDALAAFVPLDKAFQRAAKRAGFAAAPYMPSGSITARWAVVASTQADIVKIVRLTKSPMAWEEKSDGGWYVFLMYGADLATRTETTAEQITRPEAVLDRAEKLQRLASARADAADLELGNLREWAAREAEKCLAGMHAGGKSSREHHRVALPIFESVVARIDGKEVESRAHNPHVAGTPAEG